MLIVQSPLQPARIRNALVDIARNGATDLRVAVAYVTVAGSEHLFEILRKQIGVQAFNALPKTLVTSVDYGVTEPAALTRWLALQNSEVWVAGLHRLQQGTLQPAQAYHPKIYAIGQIGTGDNSLVGSANLTSRGLTANSEAVWKSIGIARIEIDRAFADLKAHAQPVTAADIARYDALRRRRPPPPALRAETRKVRPPAPVVPLNLATFSNAVTGGLNPQSFDAMWIEARTLSGGSASQLELPRYAHRFFGAHFTNFGQGNKVTITNLNILSGRNQWNDRLLTWHGNNMMERINLPTSAQGGPSYDDSAIMLRRLPNGWFELVVAPWESSLARSWRQASTLTGHIYRLGRERQVGLI